MNAGNTLAGRLRYWDCDPVLAALGASAFWVMAPGQQCYGSALYVPDRGWLVGALEVGSQGDMVACLVCGLDAKDDALGRQLVVGVGVMSWTARSASR